MADKTPPSTLSQFFPPKAVYTDKDIPSDLAGKVYFITGANSGMGAELTKVLYSKNATVYVACRSKERGEATIKEIKAAFPNSKGRLVFLLLDQADLAQTKAAAQSFLAQETRLDVLFNNAGVMTGDSKPMKKTAQGHELALGVNCVAPFLLTKLLHPLLKSTAETEPTGAVRIVWLSSYALVGYAPKEKGVDMDNLDYQKKSMAGIDRYGVSKAGDWLLAVECARRFKADGIASVAINPGNVTSGLPRHQGCAIRLVAKAVCYPAINGVYCQLFAAFSPAINTADWTAEWVIPWGRLAPLRADLPTAVKPKSEGGNGNSEEFWVWNENQVKEFL